MQLFTKAAEVNVTFSRRMEGAGSGVGSLMDLAGSTDTTGGGVGSFGGGGGGGVGSRGGGGGDGGGVASFGGGGGGGVGLLTGTGVGDLWRFT